MLRRQTDSSIGNIARVGNWRRRRLTNPPCALYSGTMSELQLYSGTQPRPAAAANAKRFGRPVLAAVKSSRRPGSRCLRLSEAYKAGFLQRERSRNPDSTHQRFLHRAVEEAAS